MVRKSEVDQLHERLLLEAQAVYLGLSGYRDEVRLQIIQQRQQPMYRTIRQLDACIGRAKTDIFLSEALEMSFQAYKKERLQIYAPIKECPQRERSKKPAAKESRRKQ